MTAAAVDRLSMPRKRVLKDRDASLVYSNGPANGQEPEAAAEALLTAILKVERDPEIVRALMGESEIDPSAWSEQLDGAITEICTMLDAEPATDDVLAEEFGASHPNIAYGQNAWMRYDGAAWSPVHEAEAEKAVQGVIIAAKGRARSARTTLNPSASILASVARFARNNAFVPDGRWDRNPDIIVCRDKTLDIASGGSYVVRENDPSDYARDALPFEFDPEASCAVWRWFLEDQLPPEIGSYLQEFAGYCLTGDTDLEHAVITAGDMGGGRSTFQEGLNAMLGGRRGTLSIKDITESRFGLSGIVGKTLLSSTENPGDYLKDTKTIDALVSGDTVRVERKGVDGFDYDPIAKILWAVNDLPQLRDQHAGFWRRIHVVDFPQIPPEKRNPAVKEAIKLEGPGILVWALEGLRRLKQRSKFDVPISVKARTAEWRNENDLPAQFLAFYGIAPGDKRVTAQLLTQVYNLWRRHNGSLDVSSQSAGKEWKRLGLTKADDKRGRGWLINSELARYAEGAYGRVIHV